MTFSIVQIKEQGESDRHETVRSAILDTVKKGKFIVFDALIRDECQENHNPVRLYLDGCWYAITPVDS